jgi:RNA polymerase sigma-70 factor, ECF subfamily
MHTKYLEHKKNRTALLQMDDEDLMDRFQAGTIDAFNILADRYRERLQNYVYRFVQDTARCEDMVQETFLRVYRNRHSYRRIAKFSTWLYTIAGNLGRSEYRKRKRRQVYSLQSVNRDSEEYELQLPDPAKSPEERASLEMQLDYLRKALDKLPEGFREVVVLRDVQQLSYEEVSEITGLPMGTVKSRIHRGRVQIQRMLHEVYPTAGGPGAIEEVDSWDRDEWDDHNTSSRKSAIRSRLGRSHAMLR